MNKLFIVFLVLCLNSLSYASIYQQTDSQGDVTYTDTPSNNAKEVSLPSNSISTPSETVKADEKKPKANSKVTDSIPTLETDSGYSAFGIESPKNLETIQNEPIISVKINISPELKAGDTIQVFLNGQATSDPIKSTRFELKNVERGTHQLYAVLYGADKTQLKKSNPITIFVHRNSVVTSPASARPAPPPPQ